MSCESSLPTRGLGAFMVWPWFREFDQGHGNSADVNRLDEHYSVLELRLTV